MLGALLRQQRRTTLLVAGVAGLLFSGISTAAPLPTERPREYDLKAVLLYNFALFTEWPAHAFPGKDSPLIIGIFGDDPFGAAIDQVVENEAVNGRKLLVQRYRRLQDVQACHILFISRSEADRVDRILAALKQSPILVISDIERFAANGGMVAFVNQGSRVQLEINRSALREGKISLSSKLLRLPGVVVRE
jgi:hypothetical protein